jgi:Ig-like domain from next to BRCA1 gene/PASTA domain
MTLPNALRMGHREDIVERALKAGAPFNVGDRASTTYRGWVRLTIRVQPHAPAEPARRVWRRGGRVADRIPWEAMEGELPDGDVINVSVQHNAAAPDAIDFVLEAGSAVSWWKGLRVPDGQGSVWEIWTQDARRTDAVALWANQVKNGQSLEFRKAKLLQVHTGMYLLGDLQRLQPGDRVTFRWVQDAPPDRGAAAAGGNVGLQFVLGRGYWARPNQVFSPSVKMRNTGSQKWSQEARYKLASANPSDNLTWGLNRVELPYDVEPGGVVDFQFQATAPAGQGTYQFYWGMVQDGIARFGTIHSGGGVVSSIVVSATKPATPPPPPPPPPPVKTTVPSIVGKTLDEAWDMVQQAHLRLVKIGDPDPYYTPDNQKKVTAQSPKGGATVDEGSAVEVTVVLVQAPPQGISKLQLYNCNPNRTALSIWVYDHSIGGWQKTGTLASNWSGGYCPTGAPLEIALSTGRIYTVVAVDTSLTNCPGDDPNSTSCRRWEASVSGDANGPGWAVVVG